MNTRKVEEAVNEYYECRIRLIKAFRKLNYRLDAKGLLKCKYLGQKEIIIKEMRKMDKLLKCILEKL